MQIPGERIKRTRLVQSEKYVVAVEVEMVIPIDDPSEPCYESETVELLRQVSKRGRTLFCQPLTGSVPVLIPKAESKRTPNRLIKNRLIK